jgi:hypothetical protein
MRMHSYISHQQQQALRMFVSVAGTQQDVPRRSLPMVNNNIVHPQDFV